MAEKKNAEAGRWDRTVRRVGLTSTSYWGLTLGELRKVVAAADGIGDEAEVTFEGLSKHYGRVDEWHAKTIRVHEEIEPEGSES